MERCSTLLIIKEIQIETIITLIRVAIKKSTNNTFVEGVKKRESSYTIGGSVNWSTLENSMKVP